ncbi:MAG: hypothetical protein AAGD13_02955 [Pseudomonadota bacterium]
MIVLLEICALAAIGFMVFVLFRAAAARPDDPQLRAIARIGLAAWVVFAVVLLIDFEALVADPLGALSNLAALGAIVAIILGYRHLLGKVKDRAN